MKKNNIKKFLRNKNASGCINTMLIILAVSVIAFIFLTYIKYMTIINTTKNNFQTELDGFIIEKSIDIYESIKSGGKEVDINDFSVMFTERIIANYSLVKNGNLYYNLENSGDIVYYFNNYLVTTITENMLELKINYEIGIPVTFAGVTYELKIPIRLNSMYNIK